MAKRILSLFLLSSLLMTACGQDNQTQVSSEKLSVVEYFINGEATEFVEKTSTITVPTIVTDQTLESVGIVFDQDLDEGSISSETFYLLEGIDSKISGNLDYDSAQKMLSLQLDEPIKAASYNMTLSAVIEGITDKNKNVIEPSIFNIALSKVQLEFDKGIDYSYEEQLTLREELATVSGKLIEEIFYPQSQENTVYFSAVDSYTQSPQHNSLYKYETDSKNLTQLYSETEDRTLWPIALDGNKLVVYYNPIDFSGGMCNNFFESISSEFIGRFAVDLNHLGEMMEYELPQEVIDQGNAERDECGDALANGQ